ncbi:chemotaxis protein CheW [Anaerolineae bacterium]|nr:chemotaxis protein CheW [Anaerolineaceae bacterium]GBL37205.1 chemotaxis protein CheW [Anaerolineaceae bacterium]GDX68482.1 chemotaxis protein CheW [Anaerolineae bacterium]
MTNQIQTDNRPKPGKYLTFMLGAEHYSLPILKVREIMRLCPITPVPRMPVYIQGVINLRGKIVPVLDLRARFRLPEFADRDRVCIIVVQLDNGDGSANLMGMIVDMVEEVSQYTEAEIEPTPDFGSLVDTRYITGMTKTKGTVKTLLDLDKLLTMDGDIDLQQVFREAA